MYDMITYIPLVLLIFVFLTAGCISVFLQHLPYRCNYCSSSRLVSLGGNRRVCMWAGFHTEGGSLEFSPPPPPATIFPLKKSWNWVWLLLFCLKQQSCPRLRQKQSERIKRAGMPPDPHSRHARLHVCERAFACYYHHATILFFPTQNPVSNPGESAKAITQYTSCDSNDTILIWYIINESCTESYNYTIMNIILDQHSH